MDCRVVIACAFSISTMFACGGSQPAANPPATEADASAAKEAPVDAGAPSTASTDSSTVAPPKAESNFHALSTDKKVEVMATKVVPSVGKVFKDHDSAKYGRFGCATCHGPTRKENPHKVLPKLTFSNGGVEKLSKEHPETMKFMAEKVVPAMATAMGEKPLDPATKQGFGCGGCHKID
jgi:cytochrome c551/c552